MKTSGGMRRPELIEFFLRLRGLPGNPARRRAHSGTLLRLNLESMEKICHSSKILLEGAGKTCIFPLEEIAS
jgi:hypothetical protein